MRKKIIVLVAVAMIVAAVSAAGLALTACGSSSEAAATTPAGQPASGGQPADMSAAFTEALDTLVQDGTITSDQQSAIISALETSAPSAGTRPDGGAPADGDAPADGSTPPSRPDPAEMFSSALDPLVDDGTISSAQETAIIEALSSAMPAAPSQSQ